MIIPKLHYKSQGKTPEEQLEHIQKACTSGIELVQLDFDSSSEKQYLKLVKDVRALTAHYQTRLILTDNYKIAREVKADGVFFEFIEKDVLQTARNHIYTWQIIGAKATNLLECEQLIEANIDYINLTPFETADKTEEPKSLGKMGYQLITEALETQTPVLGSVGIQETAVKDILEAGISGVILSDEITADFNRIKIYNQLLGASATDEQRHTF